MTRLQIAIGTIPLTFGVSIQFCSEAEWTNGDVGRDSKQKLFLRFDWFLGLFADHTDHLRLEARCRKISNRHGAKPKGRAAVPRDTQSNIYLSRSMQAAAVVNSVIEILSRSHRNRAGEATDSDEL